MNYVVTAGSNSTDLGIVGKAATIAGAKRIGRAAVRTLPNAEGTYSVRAPFTLDRPQIEYLRGECSIRTEFKWHEQMLAPPVGAVKLRAIMAAHSLTRGDIARMLGLEPRKGGSHGTVDMWLSGARNIPASKLELIGIKAPRGSESPEFSDEFSEVAQKRPHAAA